MVRQSQSIDSVRAQEKSSSLLKPKKSMVNPASKGLGVTGVKEKYVNSRHVSVIPTGTKQFNHSQGMVMASHQIQTLNQNYLPSEYVPRQLG